MKICVFGGSFDPPHAGHRYLADSALASLSLDRLIWVPAADPPHKTKPSTPFEHRLAMVRLAIQGRARQEASDVEARLPQPSYTIRTLETLQAELGREHEWYLLIGADNWSIFPTWHRWQDVQRAAHLVVFPRRGHPLQGLPREVIRLDLAEMDVDATGIRGSLQANQRLDARVLPEIRGYIAAHHLYAAGGK